MSRSHGAIPRGLESVPQAPSFEGRFGRMFRRLPTFQQTDEFLAGLADAMRQEDGQVTDNPAIPSGYTYFGQFVDHDITFDPASSLQRMNDPEGLVNFRTPRFDLDSLYGSGPADEPFQYDKASGDAKLLIGKGRDVTDGAVTEEDDLPRNMQERALIGDPRNDENVIVSQLHLAFIKLHNAFVDQVSSQGLTGGDLFKEAQRLTRWHYQWVVVHDLLRRLVGDEIVDVILGPDENGVPRIKTRFYDWKKMPFMPVEFAVAAYRFGHSQIRPVYLINERGVPQLPIFAQHENAGPLEDFRGGRTLPRDWTVSWHFFFSFPGTEASMQPSQLIDTKLASALFVLPGRPETERSLALLNLQRGRALGLPSGRRVATALRVPEGERVTDDELGFHEPAPLWFYVLKEAELRRGGRMLGAVGGQIVAEVLLGLLAGDPLSWINVEPTWQPTIPDTDGDGKVGLPDLLRFADPSQATPPPTPPGGWQPNVSG